MKVTVSFNSVRVVVPCGDGQLLISDLIEQAVARYSKVLGKTADFGSLIRVHYLKSADGGILDPDDYLVDVVDDKDQLNASYEMAGDSLSPPSSSATELRQHRAGDGTSACGSPSERASGGPSSPGVVGGFTAATFLRAAEQGGIIRAPSQQRDLRKDDGQSSLDLTAFPMAPKSGVRIDFQETTTRRPIPPSPFKDDVSVTTETEVEGDQSNGNYDDDDDCDDNVKSAFLQFARDPTRKSLTNNAAMFRWVDAQEKLQEKYEDDQFRKEPLGSSDEATSVPLKVEQKSDELKTADELQPSSSPHEVLIVLVNPRSPLGIHVIPGFDEFRRNTGLVIHSIEPNSTIAKDGRLHVGDRIIQVNGSSLNGLEFARAQEVFKSALQSSIVRLRVLVESSFTVQSSMRPSSIPAATSGPLASTGANTMEPLEGGFTQSSGSEAHKLAPAKVRPAVPERTSSAGIQKPKFAPITSTRLIGNVMTIELVKGPQGLGFSVTSRDNPAGDDSPIYVKNILPQGAAVSDGRLLPGDRLLQVNGAGMSGKSQEDVVAMLRGVQAGDSVTLVISRNVSNDVIVPDDDVKKAAMTSSRNSPASSRSSSKEFESSAGNAESKNDALGDDEVDYVALSIPIMPQNDGEQRTSLLGASIKGKTMASESGSHDLGLFVKAIIEGSAADKDGRLKADDQLIELNGVSLVGRSNAETMTLLRHALRSRGPSPDSVDLVVARRRTTDDEPGDWETTPRKSAPEARTSPLSTGARLRSGKSAASRQGNALRNVSYHMANGDLSPSVARSLEGVADSGSHISSGVPPSSVGLVAPTLYGRRCDTFLIETEEGSFRSTSSGTSSATSGTSGRSNRSDRHTLNNKSRSHRNESIQQIVTTVSPTLNRPPTHDVTVESSESSPVDIVPVAKFSREGLGRQSMSEKRKGHLDPRVTAFYHQVKQAKENLNKLSYHSPDGGTSPISSGPDYTSKLYRCCSLESVTMAMNEIAQKVHQSPLTSAPKIQRNRGCNESFRAAVDRSYANGKGSENSGDIFKQPESQSTNLYDEFYDERRNGKKQKSLLKTFGEVFKIGKPKSSSSEKDRAEKAYSLRDAETQRELENNLKNTSLSKPAARSTNEPNNGMQATSSPRTPRQRVFQTAVGYADSCSSLPHQWSSPEYAVLAPHRASNGTVLPYSNNKSPGSQVNNASRVQPRMTSSNMPHTVSTLSISGQSSQQDFYRQTGRNSTHPPPVNSRPAEELRSYRALPTDVHYASTSSLHRLQKRQPPPGAFAYQGQSTKLAPRMTDVGQPSVLRPMNGVSGVANVRSDRYPADRTPSTPRHHTDGFAVAGNPVSVNGTVYKFSQPANV